MQSYEPQMIPARQVAALDHRAGTAEMVPLAYTIGVVRQFGAADIATQGMGDGWSEAEGGHSWNDGPDVQLVLRTAARPAAACLLSVEGVPYLPPGIARQRITLYANGYRIGFWSLSESVGATLAAVIEPEQWFTRDGGGLLRLAWYLPDSVKPRDVGDADDHRRLGFCFRTFCIEAPPN